MDPSRCVFHVRTSAQAGVDALRPLSALRESDPAVFADALAKYDDTPERRRLPETLIPLLDVRWIDVVFLSPVQPHAIWQAWREISGIALPPKEFWAIPVDEIGPAVVFDRSRSRTGDPIDPREVEALSPETYRALTETTSRNREWIGRLAGEGKRGAWFNGTPHVLTPHPVRLDDAHVIDWSQGFASPPSV